MLNQNTNPRNGTAVAFLWELKTFPPKLCLIGFQLNSVNQFKQPRPDEDLAQQMKIRCNTSFMEVLSPFQLLSFTWKQTFVLWSFSLEKRPQLSLETRPQLSLEDVKSHKIRHVSGSQGGMEPKIHTGSQLCLSSLFDLARYQAGPSPGGAVRDIKRFLFTVNLHNSPMGKQIKHLVLSKSYLDFIPNENIISRSGPTGGEFLN